MKLIGLHGRARSGKDTFARLLNGHEPFTRMSFADPLKTAVAGLFNIPLERAFSDDKEQVLEHWGLTLRDVLQRFGTEAMRNNFGADFWIERWAAEYLPRAERENVVVTDCRFPNEAQRIRELGGTIVHIRRAAGGLNGAAAAHASEQVLPVKRGDIEVYNDHGLDHLSDLAWSVLGQC